MGSDLQLGGHGGAPDGTPDGTPGLWVPRRLPGPFLPRSFPGQNAPEINPGRQGRGLGRAGLSHECPESAVGRGQGARAVPTAGHTHGTPAPASGTGPSPLSAPPARPRDSPSRGERFGGMGSAPPAPPALTSLRGPARFGSVRLGGSLGSAAAAAARAALHLFPRGRPGRRVRGAVGTFATLLAFHRRHVTPRHSTPLPPHSSGGRAFQGGKGREGLQHPPGPPAHGPPVPSGRPSAGPPHGEVTPFPLQNPLLVTAAPRWALAGRGSAASTLWRRNGLG